MRGTCLREALGLREGDLGEDVPWIRNMLVWGYPPGWARVEDPVQTMRTRVSSGGDINGSFIDGAEEDSFVIFGDEGAGDEQVQIYEKTPREDGMTALHTQTPQAREARSDSEGYPRRWATYQTSMFSSELLPVYNGRPLPPLGEEDINPMTMVNAASFSKKTKGDTPPWRRSRAFEDNWLDYSSDINVLKSPREGTSSNPLTPLRSPICNESEHIVDMDFSD